MSSRLTVTNVLGETPCVDRLWPDDADTCPWCNAALPPTDRELADEHHRSERSAEYIRREPERRAADVADAHRAGYCLLCFGRFGLHKRIRHGATNYHEIRTRS